MDKQRFYLGDYDWEFLVYYNSTSSDLEDIMYQLVSLGCGKRQLMRAKKNISSGKLNNGLTFSKNRVSCIVLGKSSDTMNFANTFAHEVCHSAIHIASYYGFSTYGERLAYLVGDISAIMLPYASKYMCHCCNKKKKL